MFIPFISSNTLFKRKGGGGGGSGGSKGGSSSSGGSKGGSSSSGSSSSSKGGSSSSSSKGGSSGSSSGSSSSSSSSSGSRSGSSSSSSSSSSNSGYRGYPISSGSGSTTAGTRSNGIGSVSSIPSGQLFSGRSIGGGTRNQVFGNRAYGSGYPGTNGLGVGGRGFPFYFWPVVWGGAAGVGTAAYLHNNEYGSPNNGSRPGGAMEEAAFKSNSTGTIYRLLADNSTVTSLIQDINTNCSSYLTSDSAKAPSNFDDSKPDVRPEQAVQYYRASSVVLSLDGYNNSAVFNDTDTPASDLPSGIDTNLLDCLNYTIGTSVPLVSGAHSQFAVPSVGFLGLFYVIWALSPLIV